jgi:hypothetical protein
MHAQVMASKLDVPFVNFQMYAPVEPFQTSSWRGSNRNAFNPNPLAYFPQKDSGIETHLMVGGKCSVCIYQILRSCAHTSSA